jgi:hypothetical protein
MGMLRPEKPLGMYPKEYWATKIGWKHCADIVLTGDSRMLIGVSPAQMQKILNDRRVVNYAFGSNWYSQEYLEAVEQVLDPQSHKKTIVIGISPHSLTEGEDGMGNFFELRSMSKSQAYLNIHFAGLMEFLEPMSFRDAFQGLFPFLSETQTRKEYFADGWVAVNKNPAGEKREPKRYRQMYEKSQVSKRTIETLEHFVSKWTQSGINIYGFLLPSCREMVELENKMSGFNQAEVVSLFEAAGGVWIDVDQCHYESFDGSTCRMRQLWNFQEIWCNVFGTKNGKHRIRICLR